MSDPNETQEYERRSSDKLARSFFIPRWARDHLPGLLVAAFLLLLSLATAGVLSYLDGRHVLKAEAEAREKERKVEQLQRDVDGFTKQIQDYELQIVEKTFYNEDGGQVNRVARDRWIGRLNEEIGKEKEKRTTKRADLEAAR